MFAALCNSLAKNMNHGQLSKSVGAPSHARVVHWASIVVTGALLAVAGLQAADGISNMRASQRTATALVDIHYDLATSNPDGLFVSVWISTNGGLTYDLAANQLTGDVGAGVIAGTDKHIVWDAVRDWPDGYSTNVFFRLTASEAPPGMVLIPAGPFMMGDTFGEGWSRELPVHEVYVSAFYMDQYEVTKALWDEVRDWANANGYDLGTVGGGNAADHPVYSVNWYDCVKWCNARSEMEGRVPAYYTDAGQTTVYRTGEVNVANNWVKWNAGYRLPTEAEWEKAARGGVEGHRFPWSDTDEITHARANYRSDSQYAYDTSPTRGYHPTFSLIFWGSTSPMGSFAPNGYGLYDMAGNVFEWCWDWLSETYYASSPEVDPVGPASGSDRIGRGGTWGDLAFGCRVAFRYGILPRNRAANGSNGFRSVLPPSASTASLLAVFGPAMVDTRPPIAPQVVGHPMPSFVSAGNSATFTVSAIGTARFDYQWRKDGLDLPGATSPTLILSGVTLADAGVYSVEVRNAWGRVRSLPATLGVGLAPEILVEPVARTVTAGAEVRFAVVAQGTPPLGYQWFKDGVELSGATGPELWLSSVTQVQAGDYRVEIRNPFIAVVSTAARLEVLAPPGIVSGPIRQLLEPGQSLGLSVVASGDGPLQYQWLLNGTRLEGETGPTLQIDSAQWQDSGSYSVVVANPVGAIESDPAEVQVGMALLGLTDAFDDRPAYADLTGIGRGSTLGASREPGEPAHGGWIEGGSVWLGWQAPADGILRVSTRGSSFDTGLGIYTGEGFEELSLVAWDDDRGPHLTSDLAINVTAGSIYNLVVDGYAGQQGAVVLTWALEVTDELSPMMVSGPDSVTVGVGDTAVFEVQALPGQVSHQWLKDGVAIPGATAATLTLPVVDLSDIANYQVLVTLGARSVRSRVATLQINLTDGAVEEQARARDKFLQPGRVRGSIARLDRGPRRHDFVPPVRGWSGMQVFSTAGHRKEAGEPRHGGRVGGASAWYSIEAERSGWMLVTTEGSSFDTVLAVYEGPPYPIGFGELTLLGEDDNSGPDGTSSQVVVEVVENGVYHFAIDGVNGAQGQAQLRYEIGQAPSVVRTLKAQRPLVGQPLALSVAVASELEVTYEWWRDGVLVAQTTEGTIELGAAAGADTGDYLVKVKSFAGEEVIGPVRVQVLGPDVLRFGPGTGPVAGGYRIEVERPLAGQLVVERSWDLETWEPVWTDAPIEEVVEWIDLVASNDVPRFYRARLEAGD